MIALISACGPNESRAQDVEPDNFSTAQEVGRKSPTLAFGLSGLGLLIPASVGYYRLTDGTADLDGATFAILAGGIIVGPALGHFYAGDSDRAWAGMTIRLLSGLATTGGTFAAIILALGGTNPIAGVLIMAAGVIVGGTSAVLDVVRAPAAAQAWNERHHLTVRPILHPQTSSFGATVAFTF